MTKKKKNFYGVRVRFCTSAWQFFARRHGRSTSFKATSCNSDMQRHPSKCADIKQVFQYRAFIAHFWLFNIYSYIINTYIAVFYLWFWASESFSNFSQKQWVSQWENNKLLKFHWVKCKIYKYFTRDSGVNKSLILCYFIMICLCKCFPQKLHHEAVFLHEWAWTYYMYMYMGNKVFMGKRNHIDSVKNKYMYKPLLMEKPHGINPLHLGHNIYLVSSI